MGQGTKSLRHWGKWQSLTRRLQCQWDNNLSSAITYWLSPAPIHRVCHVYSTWCVLTRVVMCAGLYVWFYPTWVFLHVLPSIPPSCHIFNPEAPARSPTVSPQLIHQSRWSAPSLYRPRVSSLRPQGTGLSVWNLSKTTETHWGPGRLN